MRVNERRQDDDLGDHYSDMTGLDCSDSKDMTRQEFKSESDVNTLLKKFGVGVPLQQQAPTYGDADYTIDFQAAIQSVRDLKQAWIALPVTIKAKYRNWQQLLNAIDKGEVKPPDFTERKPEPPAPEPEKKD